MENNSGLITSNPNIMMGKPVIAGTRITVERILEMLAAGENIFQILEAYPFLTRQSVEAAINYAIEKLKSSYKISA